MNDWNKTHKKANPVGRQKLPPGEKRVRMHISVHPNVEAFFTEYHNTTGIRPGRLIDRLMSDKFASINIGKR